MKHTIRAFPTTPAAVPKEMGNVDCRHLAFARRSSRVIIPISRFSTLWSFDIPVKLIGSATARFGRSGHFCLGGLLVVTLAVAGCQQPPPAVEATDVRVEGDSIVIAPDSPPASSITVMRAAVPVATVLSFNGRLVWDDNITSRLFSPFAGRVTKVLAEVGAPIDAGAPLALLASPDYGQVQADARRAATDLRLAERSFTRISELFEHGAAAQKDLQSAEADVERARSESQRAAERLALYGGATNEVDQAYVFRSPIAGVLVEKNISPGAELRADVMLANTPQLASPQFVVTDPERLWVWIDVPERDQARVQVGQTFVLRSTSFPNQTFSGRVDVIGDGLDPNTRTVKVRGSLANPGHLLKAEMFVKAELPLAPKSGATVHAKAVLLRGERHFVIIENAPGHYARREVELGGEQDGRILISAGLDAGQRVVTEGALLLEELFTSAP